MTTVVYRLVVSGLAGVLFWAAFPDVGWWPLFLVSIPLILSTVDSTTAGRAALYSAIFGALFWFPHIQWAQISANGGPLPWIALSTTQVIAWMIWGVCASLVARTRLSDSVRGYVVSMAIVWVGMEQLRSRFPFSGFPWGNIAYPHVDAPLGNLAPFGGETLVSFAVVSIGALIRLSVDRTDRTVLIRHWWARPLCLLTALTAYVAPVLVTPAWAQEAGFLRVAAIQGFVEVPGAHTYRKEGHVTRNHAHVTDQFLNSGDEVDLIVWGEGSLDRNPRTNSVVHDVVQNTIDKAKVPMLVGFTEVYAEEKRVRNLYGAWYPDTGLAPSLYGKQIPVPFGEYIPFRSLVAALATEAAQVQFDMEAVENSGRYDVVLNDGRTIALSLGICFEVAYEGIWAEGVHSGGQILVTPSNNYHFRTTPEPMQQAQMARFRALEFSRSAMQVSTTGESMLILPNGGVVDVSRRHAPDYLVGQLPLRTSLTWAIYTAEPLAWLAMAGFGILTFYALGQGRGRRRTSGR